MTSLIVQAGRLSAIALLSLGVATPFTGGRAPGTGALSAADGPVERLGRYIRILAAAPRDLAALLGAGQAALDVGDANAALGFFARAEEVAPSEGRAKAGLGASLVMIERPDDALRLFGEAAALGVPDVAIARDRGLAYDLRGDSRRAQRDYALAMSRQGFANRDDELIRRYALSLGISGDRAGAMAMLDPLLRRQDQGAWRARSFIMAMTGDVAGANTVARQLMVPAMANAMSPLLTRLATLNAAERAHAVNFGTVPADGTRLAVQTGDPYAATTPGRSPRSYAALPPVGTTGAGLIPAGEPLGPRSVDATPTATAQADARVPRRRSGSAAVPVRPGFTANPVAALPREVPVAPSARAPETRVAVAALAPRATAITPTPITPIPVPSPTAAPVVQGPPVEPATVPAVPMAPVQTATVMAATVPTPTVPIPTVPATTVTAPLATPAADNAVPASAPVPATPAITGAARLAGLLDGITPESETAVELPSTRELRAARQAARRKMAELAAQTAAEEVAKREKTEKAALAKRHPARIWVQVATGRNDSGLAISWRRIRDANPLALKGQNAWVAQYKATNRILVGPMKSAAAARDLVGKLAKSNLAATTYNSNPGEEVEKITTR